MSGQLVYLLDWLLGRALHGILKKVRDLGMLLPSVNSVEPDQVKKPIKI